jgi:two-component system sensor histidine kinase KdpD
MGIADITTEKTVEYVFLSLSPLEKPEVQVQLLALAARTFQNRHLLQVLQSASDAYEVYAAIQEWERSSSKPVVSDQNQQVKSGS